MKKTKIFFLALLCLFGKELYGQEVAGNPAMLGHSVDFGVDKLKTQSGSIALRLEFISDQDPGPINIFIYENLIDEKSDIPEAKQEMVPLSRGNMFEGTMESFVMDYNSEPLEIPVYISLKRGKHTLIDKFYIEPGDSVRIGIDLEKGMTFFAGPSADKWRVQQQIMESLAQHVFKSNIPFYTKSEEFYKGSPKDSAYYFNAINNQSPIRRSVKLLSDTKSKLDFNRELLAVPVSDHDAWEVLHFHKPRLEKDFYNQLSTDLLGRLLYKKAEDFRMTYDNNRAFRELFEEFYLHSVDSIPDNAADSPFYVDYLYTKNVVLSAILEKPFREFLQYGDSRLNDHLEAKLLLQNFRRFDDPNKQFEKALERISDPFLSDMLNEIYLSQRIGSPLANIALADTSGNDFHLKNLKGKFLLLSFWLPGCSASQTTYENRIAEVEKHFFDSNDLEVVYVSNENDHTKWRSIVDREVYSSSNAYNLRGSWENGSFLQYYKIRSFPTMMLIDPDGNMINNGNFLYTKDGLISYLQDSIDTFYSTDHNPSSK